MSPDPPPRETDSGSGEGALVELLARALEILDVDGREALETFLAEHSDAAPALRRRLELLGRAGLDPGRGRVEALPETLGDFRLKRPLGSGGMGVVWLAEQVSLGREVAIKLVRPDQLLFSDARERFRREVETVARFQHPGIVPVHAVGEEKGIPYFAMERVHGASLDLVLRSVEGRDPAKLAGADLAAALPPEPEDPTPDSAAPTPEAADPASELFEGSWTEVCLRIVREVAEALEHARRRGVVHRDVKPANVMVTRGGRVLLLDFGLSSRGTDARLTRSGSAVGSLAYMAPELLAVKGRAGPPLHDDPRQDVYSLGVTLYELLALEPPFRGDTELSLLRALAVGEVAPLRKRNGAVPIDAALVTAVAMDRDPARRYEDPGALARDLGNVLARRPIEASPPGVLLRARRWLQRHPVAATVVAALVLGPSALLAQEARARRVVEAKNEEIREAGFALASTNAELESSNLDIERALSDAAEQRDRAEAALDKAMEAVDRMLVHVGDEALRDVPGMERVRGELLEEALEFQEWFLAAEGETPRLRRRAIEVARGAVDVLATLGRFEDALAALERAEELVRAELGEGVADRELRAARANFDFQRGKIARVEGDLALSEQRLREARAAAELLEEGDPKVQRTLAKICVELARTQSSLGAVSDARESYEQSLALLEPLHEAARVEEPEFDGIASDLAFVRNSLGHLLWVRARTGSGDAAALSAESMRLYEAAAELGEDLVARNPRVADYRFRLARSLNGIGAIRTEAGDLDGARDPYLRSLELMEGLVRDFPGVPYYLGELANRCANLGGLLVGRGGEEERARELYERGAEAFAAFFATNDGHLELRLAYAVCLANLGSLQRQLGDREAAVATCDLVLETIAAAIGQAPLDPTARNLERVLLNHLMDELVLLGDLDRARAVARRHRHRAAVPATASEVLATLAAGYAECRDAPAEDGVALAERDATLEAFAILASETLADGIELGELDPAAVEAEASLAPFLAHETFRSILAANAARDD